MNRWMRWLGPLLVLAIGAGVLAFLHHELRRYDYHAIVHSLRAIPPAHVAFALALTALSYVVLTGYDALALRQIGRSPGYGRTALASFIAYVLSYNLGFAAVSGTAVRFRLYSAWGFSTGEIAQIATFTAVTFWAGLFAAAGALFASGLVDVPPGMLLTAGRLQWLGAGFLLIVAAYLLLCVWRRTPLVVKGWTLPLPRWPVALQQVGLGALDVVIATLVVWMLMPSGWPHFFDFLGLYMLGLTAGLISHVPGGLGVTEAVILYGRPETVSAPAVLGSLLAFRAVYYLLPLGAALLLVATYELGRQRARLQGFVAEAGRWLPRVAPRLFAVTVFIAGILLLVSGATPAAHGRLTWLKTVLPLPVLEFSHLLGSVIGVALLFLARGLQRRMDAAYVLTLLLLAGGAVLSLLKGFDWEEAAVLLAMFALMLPCREAFYRRTPLHEARFTPGWIVAIVLVLGAVTWLGFFAHRHVEYRDELWWHFAFRADAPRFLRASVAGMAVALCVGLWRLLHPMSVRPQPPAPDVLERVAPIVAASRESTAHLALVGDKTLLFGDSGRSFLMYAVEGHSWVALGEPVGPAEEHEDLVWEFRELVDRHAGWAVFYQVGGRSLPLYVDAGMTLTKLGEEARVPLAGFNLDGGERRHLRQAVRKLEREGGEFGWLEPADVPAALPELRAVSDAWLAERATREKQFSLGRFDATYLSRGPVAVVRHHGRIVAFANVWCGAEREELSVDLMRHHHDAPAETMDFLLVTLMQRGARDGYAWFNLGMAPMSGLENRALAPAWHRLGSLVFQHGEHFYGFQGLRAYKEKFRPVWTPRYLATPGLLHLPMILTNVAALISGGMKGVIRK